MRIDVDRPVVVERHSVHDVPRPRLPVAYPAIEDRPTPDRTLARGDQSGEATSTASPSASSPSARTTTASPPRSPRTTT